MQFFETQLMGGWSFSFLLKKKKKKSHGPAAATERSMPSNKELDEGAKVASCWFDQSSTRCFSPFGGDR